MLLTITTTHQPAIGAVMTNGTTTVFTQSIWTEADFDSMGWHDVTVHGLTAS